MPTATEADRQAFWSTLTSELPAFVDFLMNYQIPPQLVSHRFGVMHYHHPDILKALQELSQEAKLLNLILAKLPHDLDHITNGQWIGTAEELEQVLTHKDSPVQRQALQVLCVGARACNNRGRQRVRR